MQRGGIEGVALADAVAQPLGPVKLAVPQQIQDFGADALGGHASAARVQDGHSRLAVITASRWVHRPSGRCGVPQDGQGSSATRR